jgi:CHRD domain
MTKLRYSAALFGLAFAFCTGSSAFAETLTFKAPMNAANESPANGSQGTGTADITFDTATRQLTWKITYSGLTGPATMGHFHGPAEPGKNAGVVLAFANPASPIQGSATLTEAQAADLLAGKWYVNVHTAQNKGGEIRGQVSK